MQTTALALTVALFLAAASPWQQPAVYTAWAVWAAGSLCGLGTLSGPVSLGGLGTLSGLGSLGGPNNLGGLGNRSGPGSLGGPGE